MKLQRKATVTTTDEQAPVNVFKNKNFVLLWLAQIVSGFGSSLTSMALLLLVNALTGSPASIATLVIVEAIPTIAIGLLAGAHVDRSNQKQIMILSDVLRAATVLCFCFIRNPEQLWWLYGLAFLQAAVGTFFNPARGAIMQRVLLPNEQLRANSLAQTTDPIVRVIGTGVAGFMIGTTKLYWPVFVVDAATFVVAATLVLFLASPGRNQAATESAQAEKYWASLTAGFAYIVRSRAVLTILMAASVTMLGMGALNVLLTPLLINDLKATPTWFAPIELANVIGTIVTGALFAAAASKAEPKVFLPLGLLALATDTLLFALVQSPLAIAAVMFLMGVSVSPINIGIATMMQRIVPNEMMGRFGASANMVIEMATLASMAFAGVLAASIGIRNVFVVSAAIVAAAAALAWAMLIKKEIAS